ncbi:uncharacterized protein LOC114742690 [Neltuma alba]|uniref:uncharacterized protein LOC114742690 n=1 Tax=Neltuma alba TaxID=207710 RepID=UPI0010A57914|nr:uncharacterized protein LOC114742690 [Prosopis alba]
MPNWEDQKCQFAENSETKQLLISKDEYPLHAGNCEDTKEMIAGLHVSLDAAPMCNVTVEMERMFQKELLDMTSDMCSHMIKSGYAHMPAFMSEIEGKDNVTGDARSGSWEETKARSFTISH